VGRLRGYGNAINADKFERIVRRWWSDNPEAMIGVPTGAPSGFWVLDIDVPPEHEDGRIWLAAMEAEHGRCRPRVRLRRQAAGGTTCGATRTACATRRQWRLGVDTRGTGGYIVMPGSVMDDGRAYTWDNDLPIADAPEWLLAAVLPRAPVATPASPYTPATGTNDHYVNSAVDAELADLASTGKGGRGAKVNSSAYSLGTLVAAGALSRSEAEAGLFSAAVACGVVAADGEAEIRRKIRRGLDAGMQKPRDIPEEQDNTRLVDITRMLANARRKAGLTRQHTDKEETSPTGDNIPEREHTSAHSGISGQIIPIGITPANDNSQPAILTATPFQWIDPKTLPRREFAFGTHYIRKYVSVTVAPGGLGKTANSIVEALAMTSGRPLSGTKPPAPLRVWVFNAEDPRDELDRRIMAACIHYNLKPDDLHGRLFLDSGREQELVIAREDKKAGIKIIEPIAEAVASLIMTHGIDVMIVDPFVSTHRVNENDNGAIDVVAKLWAQIANDTNCAIDIVHHLRKVADREATVEDARGAVSLIGAARSVRVLNRMTADQAKQAAVDEDDRTGTFSITYGKSNLTKLSSKADWRRLESVPLGNGRGLSKPQDFAPVVTEWKWPSAEDIVQEVTADQREAIRVAVSTSDYKPSARAKNWAGHAVAYALDLDMEDDGQAKRAGAVLRALLKEGVLVEVEERDPVRRESAKFIRAA
jgi:hypothetical protein